VQAFFPSPEYRHSNSYTIRRRFIPLPKHARPEEHPRGVPIVLSIHSRYYLDSAFTSKGSHTEKCVWITCTSREALTAPPQFSTVTSTRCSPGSSQLY
jgi:hypothetical protein